MQSYTTRIYIITCNVYQIIIIIVFQRKYKMTNNIIRVQYVSIIGS